MVFFCETLLNKKNFTMRKILFLPLFCISFFYSCSSDLHNNDQPIYEEYQKNGRDCLTVTEIESNDEACCKFKVCAQGIPGFDERWYIFGQDQEPTLGKGTCWEIEVCETTSVTLVKEIDDTSYICEVELVCDKTPSQEECCESLCFDYSYTESSDGCYTIAITLDGDDECFPPGLRFKNGVLTYLGDNGSIGGPLVGEDAVYYEFCQENPFPLDEFFMGSITAYGCTLNFVFDLFGEGPFDGQCVPIDY